MAATKLALYRRKKGLTQEQLAELSGVTARTIQRIEKGAVVPHIQTLKMLADCLDIDPEILMDEPEGHLVESIEVKAAPLNPLFHLLGVLGLFMPVLNVLLPFGLWILKKHENPDYDKNGRQILNFQITTTLLFFPSIILMVFYFPIGFPLTMLTYLFMFITSLVNLFRSVKSLPVKYPLSISFFKV